MDQLESEYPVLEVPQRKVTLAEVPATILALHPDQVVVETQKELVKAQAQALLQEPLQLQALLQESVQLEALLQESVQLEALLQESVQLQADEVFLVVEQLQVALQLAYCRYQYRVLRATA